MAKDFTLREYTELNARPGLFGFVKQMNRDTGVIDMELASSKAVILNEIPPIDAAAPSKIETATFALG